MQIVINKLCHVFIYLIFFIQESYRFLIRFIYVWLTIDKYSHIKFIKTVSFLWCFSFVVLLYALHIYYNWSNLLFSK